MWDISGAWEKLWPTDLLDVTNDNNDDDDNNNNNNLHFSDLTLFAGWQEGRTACKKLGFSSLVVMIWLELCTSYSSSGHHHLIQ